MDVGRGSGPVWFVRRAAVRVRVTESASRLLVILVIMTMQLGRINALNEMCACFKVK
jgi:hypothetical protein